MLSFQFNLRTCCCYLYSTICSLVFKNFDTITNMFRKTVLILIPFSCTPENTKKKKEYWSVNDSIRFDFELIADSDLFWVVFCFVEIVLLLQAKGKLRSSDNYSGSGAAAAPAAAVVAAVAAWKHIQEVTRRAVGNAERELETQLTELKSLKRQRHTVRIDYRESSNTRYTLHAVPEPATPSTIAERLAVWPFGSGIVGVVAKLSSNEPSEPRTNEDSRSRRRLVYHMRGKFAEGKFWSAT